LTYILHDNVVGGYPVTRDEEKCVLVHFVKISDFPTGDFMERTFQVYTDEGWGRHSGSSLDFPSFGQSKVFLEIEVEVEKLSSIKYMRGQ
jgi:hypothetical protein